MSKFRCKLSSIAAYIVQIGLGGICNVFMQCIRNYEETLLIRV